MSKIQDLPSEDRPIEKLIHKGSNSLSDAELLAILLKSGLKGKSVIEISQEIIKEERNIAGLSLRSVKELAKIKGIGLKKAATVSAAFEIGRRIISQSKWLINQKFNSPEGFANALIPLFQSEVKEKFMVACLNKSNKLIDLKEIFVGSLDASIVHPREIFRVAIENSSAGIILIHNHPSENAEASDADIKITKQVIAAGKILDIQVIDHIIIAGNNYLSFVEKKIF
jgi:DNA repair protein RadC